MFNIDADLVRTAVPGGLLIGAAMAVLWFGMGRLAEVSGVAGRWSYFADDQRAWRLGFIGGVILTPTAYQLLDGAPLIPSPPDGSFRVLAAGFLVGLGARMANGCTTGHTICGFGRLSLRSLTALTLMIGIATVVASITRAVGI